MRNYRNLFEQEFGENPRLLDIAGPGLPLGAKTVSPSEAFAVLNEKKETAVSTAYALTFNLKSSRKARKGAEEVLELANCTQNFAFPAPPRDEMVSADSAASSVREKITAFIRQEIEILKTLRETLSGESPLEPARLEELLDAVDYLWAHFPECAGAGGRRPEVTDLSFLKRVRTEIEPFLKCWEMTLGEL
jgi:hypothetical protein